MISYEPLKRTIKEKGYTMKDVESICKVSSSIISEIFCNKYNITTDILNKLCKGLQCNICDIVEYKKGTITPKLNVSVNWDYLYEVVVSKGYSLNSLSRMIDKCSDYLPSKKRFNRKINSDELVKICEIIGASAEEFLND